MVRPKLTIALLLETDKIYIIDIVIEKIYIFEIDFTYMFVHAYFKNRIFF